MSEISKIPFGKRISDGRFVDATEVGNGASCGCLCPSCGMPLIARQGDVYAWHFAHDTGKIDGYTLSKCEYSFWVSVVAMSKQILSNLTSFNTPDYTIAVLHNSRTITKGRLLTPERIELGNDSLPFSADAVIKIRNFRLAIILSTPIKELDLQSNVDFDFEETGIIDISLHHTKELFLQQKNETSYRSILTELLSTETDNKHWIYHPNENKIKEDDELFFMGNINLKRFSKENKNITRSHYECVLCKNQWEGNHVCPECGNHLFSRRLTSNLA